MYKKTVKDIESIPYMYATTIKHLEAAVSRAMRASNWQSAKLLQTAMSILKQGRDEIIEVVARNGFAQYEEGFEAALKELKADDFDFDEVEQILGRADVESILNAEDQVRRFFAQTQTQTRRMIQGITVQIRQRAAAEGWSSSKAFRELRNEVLGQHPDFVFVDRAGRKWEPEKYLKMVSRTLMAESQREAHAAAYTEAGVDLVKVSMHGTKCPDCIDWEGKVLSLTGATEGYPTLAEARAKRFMHPNCKHRVTAYVA